MGPQPDTRPVQRSRSQYDDPAGLGLHPPSTVLDRDLVSVDLTGPRGTGPPERAGINVIHVDTVPVDVVVADGDTGHAVPSNGDATARDACCMEVAGYGAVCCSARGERYRCRLRMHGAIGTHDGHGVRVRP